MTNLILLSDSYKVSHWRQYPPGTTNVYSYLESRGSDDFAETTFFGLQYILKRFFLDPVSEADVDEAAELYAAHFGSETMFNREGWSKIVELGYLPVRIKAVPEGTRVATSNVLMTIENTLPEFFWLTNFLETLLMQVWYPTTVATLSGAARDAILAALIKTGDPGLIDFKLHDFGFRGVSSVESAGIGGAAHLVNFIGTDTVPALSTLRKYYGAEMPGFSVPASEHSTMTAWTREREVDAYRNMIEQYGSMPFYSVVSDSYDVFGAARDLWGTQLKDAVLAAEGTLVVRPDSGYPPHVVTYLLEILGNKFGFEHNSKGYKVLDPKVRVIQGDGLSLKMINVILGTMEHEGWSADNVVFGMGGGLLQQVNRDTMRFAFKCSSVEVDGEQRDVFKAPATDSAKDSKRGRLGLYHNQDDGWTTDEEGFAHDLLELVYENGSLLREETLDEIRARAQSSDLVMS